MGSITSFTPQGVTLFVRSRALFAEGNLVLCPQADNDVSLQLNDVVSLRTQTQKETLPKKGSVSFCHSCPKKKWVKNLIFFALFYFNAFACQKSNKFVCCSFRKGIFSKYVN